MYCLVTWKSLNSVKKHITKPIGCYGEWRERLCIEILLSWWDSTKAWWDPSWSTAPSMEPALPEGQGFIRKSTAPLHSTVSWVIRSANYEGRLKKLICGLLKRDVTEQIWLNYTSTRCHEVLLEFH